MTEQTDAAEVDEFEPLRQSLRWHFACHADEPDKSYASLGIENAERIVRQMLTAREAAAEVRGAQAVLAAVEAIHTASVVMQWINPLDGPAYQEEEWSCDICGWFPTGEACETLTAARAAAAAAGGGGEA